MKSIAAAALAFSTLFATTASAEWFHSPFIAGQYEGGLNVGEQLSVNYGCAGYHTLSFYSPNKVNGDLSVVVDGSEVWKGPQGESNDGMWLPLAYNANHYPNQLTKDEFNKVIEALSSGNEAQIVTASGEVHATYTLEGSKSITNCEVW